MCYLHIPVFRHFLPCLSFARYVFQRFLDFVSFPRAAWECSTDRAAVLLLLCDSRVNLHYVTRRVTNRIPRGALRQAQDRHGNEDKLLIKFFS